MRQESLICSVKKLFYLDFMQQKRSKMHLPRMNSFLLKYTFLTLSCASEDGYWAKIN